MKRTVGKYAVYFKETEIFPIPELVAEVEPKTLFYIIADLRTRTLAGIRQEAFEEFRKWISMMYHNPYVLAFESLLHRLRNGVESPLLRGIPFASPLSAKVSAYADDITVSVSRYLDIKVVKKAVARYEEIAVAKIKFYKSECLRLGAWRGGIPIRWSDRPIHILGVTLQQSLSKLLWGWTVDRSIVNVRVMGVYVCQNSRTIGLLKDWLTWDDPCRRTRCGCERRAIPFLASSQTPWLKVNVGWKTKHCLSANAVRPCLCLTELFEIELFFDMKTVFTLNWIVTYNCFISLK